METSVACQACGRSFRVPRELLGQRVRCLQCHEVFVAQDPASRPETALQARPPARGPWRPPEDDLPEAEDSPPRRARPRPRRQDHGVPEYLWLFALLPWGILVLTLGGCAWGLLAGVASAAAVGLTQARRLPAPARLGGLVGLNVLLYLAVLVVGGVRLSLPRGPEPYSAPDPGPAGRPVVAGPSRRPPRDAFTPAPAHPARPAAAPEPPSDPGPPVPPPVEDLFTRGPRVYLADLHEYGVRSGPWPFSRNGVIGPDNHPIVVNGVRSPNGLGLHPPDSPGLAVVRYRLGKQAAVFRTGVALNDTAQIVWSKAVFEVYGDGRRLWQADPVGKGTPVQECRLDVRGVDVLELRVGSQGSHLGLHAVWLEPRLLQRPDTPDR